MINGKSRWQAFCPAAYRRTLMGILVGCFVAQTYLVYSDRPSGGISDQAQRGRELWHSHNCQSCHQVYGFGGFLGPDLTNAARRVPRSRLEGLLRDGMGAMPAFGLSDSEIDDLSAYFEALDATGVGQPRNPALRGLASLDRFHKVIEDRLQEDAEEGLRQGVALTKELACHACHVPFQVTGVVPDVSTAGQRLTTEEIDRVLREGPGIMPTFDLDEAQRGALVRYLQWLSDNRDQLQAELAASTPAAPIRLSELPWWTYD